MDMLYRIFNIILKNFFNIILKTSPTIYLAIPLKIA